MFYLLPRLPIHNSPSVTTDRDWGRPLFLIVCYDKEVVVVVTKRNDLTLTLHETDFLLTLN